MTITTRLRLLASGLLLAATLGGVFAAPAAAGVHYQPARVIQPDHQVAADGVHF